MTLPGKTQPHVQLFVIDISTWEIETVKESSFAAPHWFLFFSYSIYDYHDIHLVWKHTVPCSQLSLNYDRLYPFCLPKHPKVSCRTTGSWLVSRLWLQQACELIHCSWRPNIPNLQDFSMFSHVYQPTAEPFHHEAGKGRWKVCWRQCHQKQWFLFGEGNPTWGICLISGLCTF